VHDDNDDNHDDIHDEDDSESYFSNVTNLNDGKVVDVVVTGGRNDWQKKFVEWSHTKMNKRNRHIMMMMMMMMIIMTLMMMIIMKMRWAVLKES
jgi:hypothetical protein